MHNRLILIAAVILLLCQSKANAGLVINEVMANEPGSSTTLEWIEIYNDSDFLIERLYTYRLIIGVNQISFLTADSIELAPGKYFIVCRRLYASGNTPGFESEWGDASGFWGDTPYEQTMQTPFDVSFSLGNNSGTVDMLNLFNTIVSSFTWTESGLDGYSWERKDLLSSVIKQSLDPSGSTPGIVNSVTPLDRDLAIDSVRVTHTGDQTQLLFALTNRGLTTISGSSIELVQMLGPGFELSIDIIDVPNLDPDFSLLISRLYTFDGLYLDFEARLPDDDRPINNIVSFKAVGNDYPPFIITEVMTTPQGNLTTEWVEIYNRHSTAIDLIHWQVGDESKLNVITDTSILIPSGVYAVVADSYLAFLVYYPDFNGILVEPNSWSVLNNDNDVVRLADEQGVIADQLEYQSSFDLNFTWSRVDAELSSTWGRSAMSGGSPGEENLTLISPDDDRVSLNIFPAHFSPDGDGYEDFTTIEIAAPEAIGYKLRIYDRDGRMVRSFVNDQTYIQPEYLWNGYSDDGVRLPIGIYIVHLEATGVESTKAPVVIAR